MPRLARSKKIEINLPTNKSLFKPIHKKNIIIYVLCFNHDTYNKANNIYREYYWAKPIIMKYQDYTFENAIWKQLLEIKGEWIHCEMVGTISWKANTKVHLNKIDNMINNNDMNTNYVNFYDTSNLVLSDKASAKNHPHLREIWNFLLDKFQIPDFTESFSNYWMCKPIKMLGFINWYLNICLPLLQSHPLIFEDAKYSNSLNIDNLIQLWGKPYYPHFPFVFERFHKAFFIHDNLHLN
jgi:hypothetical protein